MPHTQLRSTRATRHFPYTAAALLALTAGTAQAGYTLTTLATFNGPNGSNPAGGLTVLGNTAYGTTYYGGPGYVSGEYYTGYGTVFSIPMSGGTPTLLASFNFSNGRSPQGSLILSGNTLYGSTASGGASNSGTVFSTSVGGGSPTVLASFGGSEPTGLSGGLILSGSTLYGTTYYGGASGSNSGTVFSVPLAGGTPTILASFKGGATGSHPNAGLVLSSNTIYGTTGGGGAFGDGTVFSVPITGGTPTILTSFDTSTGSTGGGLLVSGNTLYGTSGGGGAFGGGTVFSVPITGGTPTILASFNTACGGSPNPGLILSGSMLYGTNTSVFSVPIIGGTPAILTAFNGTNGYEPGQLTLSGNTLYGITAFGGPGYVSYGAPTTNGTVFALDLTKPTPIVSVNGGLYSPGSQVGTLTLVAGQVTSNTATFTPTPNGWLKVFNAPDAAEVYAIHITDSVPANLAADLVKAVSEINAATYTGYSLAASTTDPTGQFGSGYNFYLTFSGLTLGTSTRYFGFDFTQPDGIADTLNIDTVAVAPEPASLVLLGLGAGSLLWHRRRYAVGSAI